MEGSESSVGDSSNSCVAALLHLLGSNKEASAHIIAQMYQFPSSRTHSFASVCEVCKLHKLRAYIGALTDYSHPHILLATKDRQPTTFAIWASGDSPDHVNVGHCNWMRCVPSCMLSGFLQ